MPLTLGALLLAGETGETASDPGAAGGVVSQVNVLLEAVATFETLSVARTVMV